MVSQSFPTYVCAAVVVVIGLSGCMSQTQTQGQTQTQSPPNCVCPTQPSYFANGPFGGGPPPICGNDGRNYTDMCAFANAQVNNPMLGVRMCANGPFGMNMNNMNNMNMNRSGYSGNGQQPMYAMPPPNFAGGNPNFGSGSFGPFGSSINNTGYNPANGGLMQNYGGTYQNGGRVNNQQYGSSSYNYSGYNYASANGMQQNMNMGGGNQNFGDGNQQYGRGSPFTGNNMLMRPMISMSKSSCLTNGQTMNETSAADHQTMDNFMRANPTVGIRCHTACPCQAIQCPQYWQAVARPGGLMYAQ